jgi:hypothetical protein
MNKLDFEKQVKIKAPYLFRICQREAASSARWAL